MIFLQSATPSIPTYFILGFFIIVICIAISILVLKWVIKSSIKESFKEMGISKKELNL